MCGLAGFVSLSNNTRAAGLSTLMTMVRSMQHRGPDESGVYIDDRAGLGHCRLSIVGLLGGGQPIHDETKTLWIVFNGEIYNHFEIRSQLILRGHRFYTNTDSEVIIHLFQEKGEKCVEDFNGQFSFAIWDSIKEKLFLARDRLGVRPMHYSVYNDTFFFASEIKAIFTVPGFPREMEETSLDQVFTFWTTLPGGTVFKNVFELLPGHTLYVNHGLKKQTKYWDIPLYPREARYDFPLPRMIDDIRELLIDSIKIRLRADVDVGAYLSGGLDSSGIAAMVVRHFNTNVKTYGITFSDSRFDERMYQRLMATSLSINHSETEATNNKIRVNFGRVVWHVEKPLLRTAPIPLYLLSQQVHADNIKVVLTGEGADEFFGGYDIFRETLARHFLAKKPCSGLRYRAIEELYPEIFDSQRARHSMHAFFSQGLTDIGHPFFSHLPRWKAVCRTKAFFSSDLKNAVQGYDGFDDCKSRLPPDFGNLDIVGKAQYLEIMIFLSNYLLSSQGDRVAMGNSVEIRFPYLDHRLLEYVGHVPTHWKILGLDEKHILKSVLSRLLPPQIVQRRKQAYRAPVQNCLIDKFDTAFTESYLTEKKLKETGLFDPAKVAFLLDKIRSGNAGSETDGMALSGIASSQMVHELFIADFRPDLPDCEFAILEDHRSKG